MATEPKTETVTIAPMRIAEFELTLLGVSPLIQHRFPEKSKKQIRDKKLGSATRSRQREACDPEQEFRDAAHVMKDGRYGVPVGALKNAARAAAHKDLGLTKVALSKALFIEADGIDQDGTPCVAIVTDSEPIMREDTVRVGMGAVDLRYRPEFRDWQLRLRCHLDLDCMSTQDVANLFQRAGYGIGIGEWRPGAPKNPGEFGRFIVKGQ